MNVAAHKEKKNEKAGKRQAGEARKQTTNFKKATCCPSAVVQGAARRKMVCVRGMPGITGTLGKANNHFDQTQTESGTAPPR